MTAKAVVWYKDTQAYTLTHVTHQHVDKTDMDTVSERLQAPDQQSLKVNIEC